MPHDDGMNGIPYVFSPSHYFAFLTKKDVAYYQFGDSDNETLLKISKDTYFIIVAV